MICSPTPSQAAGMALAFSVREACNAAIEGSLGYETTSNRFRRIAARWRIEPLELVAHAYGFKKMY
jgi:hypothetical protein